MFFTKFLHSAITKNWNFIFFSCLTMLIFKFELQIEHQMKFKRFIILFHTACLSLLLTVIVFAQEKETGNIEFSFGVIADCQYCSVQGTGVRKYSISPNKLEKCVAHFNTMDLEYAVHLGDFIDRDFESFDVVAPIYNGLIMPNYHVLGNHDFSVRDEMKKDVPGKMGLAAKYYDFEVRGWRFVVLDGNDISFHAYPENSKEYKKAAEYYEEHTIKSPKWNGAIGSAQLNWLKLVLDKALKNEENVVLYCHFPVYPENVHNLWNAKEIIELIESYSCVKAYMNGHNHAGNYGMKEGIHYITFKGMVDTEQTSYAVLNVYDDRLKIVGYGREENRILEIRR